MSDDPEVDELLAALAGPPERASLQTAAVPHHRIRMRQSHHQLAQLLAQGCSNAECIALTGYTGAYISSLVHRDPAFQELMAYYQQHKEAIFVDVLEKARTVSISMLDELQNRLDVAPEQFTRRELLDGTKEVRDMLFQSNRPNGTPNGAGSGVTVNIRFPDSTGEAKTIENAPTGRPVIDLETSDG